MFRDTDPSLIQKSSLTIEIEAPANKKDDMIRNFERARKGMRLELVAETSFKKNGNKVYGEVKGYAFGSLGSNAMDVQNALGQECEVFFSSENCLSLRLAS